MRAGELRHQITFQEKTSTRQSFGDFADTWDDYVTVWAAIEWKSGRRYLEAAQLNAEIEGIVRIRYRSDIEPTMRITFGNRIIEIISIANTYERNRELVISCKEALD